MLYSVVGMHEGNFTTKNVKTLQLSADMSRGQTEANSLVLKTICEMHVFVHSSISLSLSFDKVCEMLNS